MQNIGKYLRWKVLQKVAAKRTFQPQPPKKISYKTGSKKMSYIFPKESFSYISRNGTMDFLTSTPKLFS